MKRRSFLRTSSAFSLPVIVNGFNLGFLPKSAFFNMIDENSDRVLVLIQLDGGNDGLNTLIPLDQYGNLSAARPGLVIPENQVLSINDNVGLHPAMSGFRNLFDDGKLTAVQAVAYPNQNRSHFRSTDIWSSGSAADEFLTTGWLGRYFNDKYPDYPDGYPNENEPDPFAITLRYTVSETCQGPSSNYSMAVIDPFSLGQIDETTFNELPDTNYGTEMAFLIDAIAQTNAYADTVLNAANAGASLSTLYDDNNALAEQLRTVALMISGGLKTSVYIVRIGGFDTHANQVVAGDVSNGQHANLLGDLSNAIEAFQDDMRLLGLEERVLGMTFSEFGRQIRSNDSLGTDHGTAAPLFVFGSCVNAGIIGENPEISNQLGPQEGVEMQHDYRSVYASILQDWFGAEAQQVQALLFGEFEPLPIITGCETTSLDDNLPGSEAKPYVFNVFPNPVNGSGTIQLNAQGEDLRISIYDQLGREIKVIAHETFASGKHNIPFETGALPQGNYHIRISGGGWQQTRKLVKL